MKQLLRPEAELVVFPWEPRGGLGGLFSAGLAEHLSRAGRWQVAVPPVCAVEDRGVPAERGVVVTDE